MKLVLASTSPRRKELLSLITNDFIIFDSKVDEKNVEIISEYPLDLAKQKCLAGFKNFPDAIVIGADTIVIINQEILEKPSSRQEAKKMISLLSGNKHLVKTAVSIKYLDLEVNFIETTSVFFKNISEEEIEDYLNKEEYIGKSGGYGIQGSASKFIYRIEGDFYNVMGLPVASVYQKIKELGYRQYN